MEPPKTPAEAAPADSTASTQTAPQDALGKTNEELGAETTTAAPVEALGPDGKPPKKISPLKKFLRRFNVYLLLFVLIVVIAAVVSVVSFLNSKKTPKTPAIATQSLSQDALKQLANSDATVGDSGQTLTVQGNAIFSGQVLVRSDLNVAGTIKLGGTLSVPGLTVSGPSNLAAAQINSLQVATGSTFQGIVTAQNGLNVTGSSSFSGPTTASQLTVTKLIMSGNASLEVPNHIAFTGASPARSIVGSVLGAGGTASINGSDTTGTVNVNTGSGTTSGCFITITFAKPFTSTPHVLVSPVGAAAGQAQYYVTRTTTSFTLCANATLASGQAFAYDYFVTN